MYCLIHILRNGLSEFTSATLSSSNDATDINHISLHFCVFLYIVCTFYTILSVLFILSCLKHNILVRISYIFFMHFSI